MHDVYASKTSKSDSQKVKKKQYENVQYSRKDWIGSRSDLDTKEDRSLIVGQSRKMHVWESKKIP